MKIFCKHKWLEHANPITLQVTGRRCEKCCISQTRVWYWRTICLALILLPTLCQANGIKYRDGFIQDAADERITTLRTPSLNGGNSTVLGHENDRYCCGATSRERVQIAVSGVHQVNHRSDIGKILPIDGNQPVIVISDTRTYGERVDLGYVVMPKKERYGR